MIEVLFIYETAKSSTNFSKGVAVMHLTNA